MSNKIDEVLFSARNVARMLDSDAVLVGGLASSHYRLLLLMLARAVEELAEVVKEGNNGLQE